MSEKFAIAMRVFLFCARKRAQVLSLSLALLLFPLAAFSQNNLGRISGAVTDSTGAVIPGAKVTVLDTERGISRSLTADGAGEYNAPSLTPGNYVVSAASAGFKTAQHQNIEVAVGGDVRIDLQLQPGEQTQTVTVTVENAAVDTTNGTVSTTLETKQIESMPIQGGHFMYLVQASPGIQMRPGGGASAFTGNGGRADQTQWVLDGLFDANVLQSGSMVSATNGQLGDQASILPIDAISEVSIAQVPKAEYGWTSGAIVSTGLKSGTNTLHGTAHAEGRPDSWVARNTFVPASDGTLPSNFEQYGGSVGGPIKRDRLFFYLAYEGQQHDVALPATVVTPTTSSYTTLAGQGTANPTFSFPDAIAAINTAGKTVSALSAALAGCTAGLTSTVPSGVTCSVTNQGGAGGIFGNTGVGSFTLALPNTGSSNSGMAKIDYRLNAKNLFNGELFYGLGGGYAGSGARPFWRPYGPGSPTQVVRAVWIWTPTSSLVNDMRFGYDNFDQLNQIGDCGEQPAPNYASLGFVTGVVSTPYSAPDSVASCGFPVVSITGFTSLGGGSAAFNDPSYFQGVDSVSWIKGKHAFKFGFELRHQESRNANYSNLRGTIAFGGTAAFSGATPLEDFMTGSASSSGSSVLVGNTLVHLFSAQYGAYAQDDWRVTPKLTLNLGIRYEYHQPWHDANNYYANFNAATTTGLVQQTSSQYLYNGDPTDFAPRFGLAYDLTGNAKNVIRGGFAIMYSQIVTKAIDGLQNNPTGGLLFNAAGASTLGTGTINGGTISIPNTGASGINANWAPNVKILGPNLTATVECGNGVSPNPNPCNLVAIDPNLKQPYVTEWNVSVEHAFSDGLSLRVAYVGEHSSNLTGGQETNQPAVGAGYTSASAISSTTVQEARPYYAKFPWFGKITYPSNQDYFNYNGMQTVLTKRLSSGLSGSIIWTYAHALDDYSNYTTATAMETGHPGIDYASGDNDIKHHISVFIGYALPGMNSPAQLLKGWQINSSFTHTTGFPMNVADTSSDISGDGDNVDRWTMVGKGSQFTYVGGKAQIPCYGATGGSFNTSSGCAVASTVSAMPAPCVAAATAEPVNTTNPALAGTTGLTSLAKYGCYMEGAAVIVPPAPGTFGSMGRNQLRGQGFQEWDMTVTKDWRFKDRVTAQFILTSFNILNETNFASPGFSSSTGTNPTSPASFGASPSTPDVGQGTSLLGNGGPRRYQLGTKIIW